MKILTEAGGRLANLRRRISDDKGGAALVEYSVLIGLITVAAVTLIAAVGDRIVVLWTALKTAIGA